MGKFYITSLREGWMMFKGATCLTYLIYIVREDDEMRVAHRYKRAHVQSSGSDELCGIFQYRFAHIHGDALYDVIGDMQIEHLDARQRQQTDLCLRGEAFPKEVFSDTSRGVAAHHGLTAVGIEDAHGEVGLGHRTLANQDQSIGADALMTVAPFDGRCYRVIDGVLCYINIYVVVAATVHLCEGYLAHVLSFFLIGCKGNAK